MLTTSDRDKVLRIINSIAAPLFLIDAAGPGSFRFFAINKQGEHNLGVTDADAVGQRLDRVLAPERAARVIQYLARCAEEAAETAYEEFIDTTAGRQWSRIVLVPILDAAGGVMRVMGTAHDITAQKRAEDARQTSDGFVELLGTVAAAANQASAVDEALGAILRAIGLHTGWAIGHAYRPNRHGTGLESTTFSYLREGERFETLHGILVAPPVGWWLPIDALRSGEPVWITHLTADRRFPHTDAARRAGIKGALAFPVLVGSDVAAVLEFFADDDTEPDETLLGVLRQIGIQVGRVIERQRAWGERELATRLARMRRYEAAVLALSTNQVLASGDFAAAARVVTETVALTLEVARASVWLIDDAGRDLRCVALYELNTGKHSDGAALTVSDHPRFFVALESGRAIDAHDASGDERTDELAEGYLDPLGIASLLVAAIRVKGKVVGVVCHEHVGEPRTWSADETTLAGEVADQVAHALAIRDALRERHLLEAQILQVRKLDSLSAMAAGIAHDFNNLLTVITGKTDLALDEIAPTSSAAEYLRDVEDAAGRAADLCGQMLAYSGKGHFLLEAVYLSGLLANLKPVVRRVFGPIAIDFDLADSLPAIAADPDQIHQLTLALITNAAEAMAGRNGTIQVRTSLMDCSRELLRDTHVDDDLPAGPYVCLEVVDGGVGMNEEGLAKVFDPFFTTKFTGRGLGMAAALGIVRGHGGAIKVTSVEGRGTTVRVLIPVRRSVDASEPTIPGLGGGEDRCPIVLIVDDERTVLDTAKTMLQHFGYEVLTAEDGYRALEIFGDRSDDIACVLLDLTMPRMDGVACLKGLRRIRDDIPVVMSSGYDAKAVAARLTDETPAAFVQKPYRLHELREVIGSVVGARAI